MSRSSICVAAVLTASLACTGLSHAQAPDSLWQRAYGGAGPDYGFSVRRTDDGGYVLAGHTSSFGAGGNDIYLVKTNADGDSLWMRAYGGPGDEGSHCVRQTKDGGYIIAGYTESFGLGELDVYLVKTDPDGDTLWTRTYGGQGDDYGTAVRQSPDGGYFIAGYTASFGIGDDFYLIRTDPQGDTLWTRTYGGTGNDYCYGVDLTDDGGCVLVGSSPSLTPPDSDILVVKTTAAGDSIWTGFYGSAGNDYGYCVEQTADGGYIVCGAIYITGTAEYQLYLIKLFPDGMIDWRKLYGGSSDEVGHYVEQVATDQGYIVAGYTLSYGAGDWDMYLVRTASDGDTLWTATYGDSLREWAHEVQQTPDGGFILCGSARSFPAAGDDDAYLVKTRPGPAGADRPPAQSKDPLCIMASPNPSMEGIAIEYHVQDAGHVRIAIYDSLGREVRELMAADVCPGWHTTTWNARGDAGMEVAPGIYYCTISARGRSAASTVILTR